MAERESEPFVMVTFDPAVVTTLPLPRGKCAYVCLCAHVVARRESDAFPGAESPRVPPQ